MCLMNKGKEAPHDTQVLTYFFPSIFDQSVTVLELSYFWSQYNKMNLNTSIK